MRKQLAIPGTKSKQFDELNTAAESYVEQRDKRMKMSEKEHEAKSALVAAMKKHKVEVYRDESCTPALVVTLIPGEDKVKVHEADEGVGEKAE